MHGGLTLPGLGQKTDEEQSHIPPAEKPNLGPKRPTSRQKDSILKNRLDVHGRNSILRQSHNRGSRLTRGPHSMKNNDDNSRHHHYDELRHAIESKIMGEDESFEMWKNNNAWKSYKSETLNEIIGRKHL